VEFFTDTHYDFLKVRRPAYILSAAMIVIGLISLVVQGGPRYSIDFTGGLMMRVALDPVVSTADLRNAVIDATGFNPEVTRDIDDEQNYIIRIKQIEQAEGDQAAVNIREWLTSAFPDHTVEIRSIEDVGPKVGGELRNKAIMAIFWALLGILIFISWRFEFRFAVASVVPLVHDVLITIGIFSLLNIEISLAVVAALLTIVGYSLNDTIVVLDRIREDLKRYRDKAFDWVINRSINEILSRTIITSTTTFFVVFILWLIGGAVLHDFAFALMIGVLIGTYSSIFVAAPILVEWQERSPQSRTKKKK
jgi:preprotein translocase subunit SecF